MGRKVSQNYKYVEEKPEPKLCKICFEKYQTHKSLEHWPCFQILVDAGVRDVRAPTTPQVWR